MGDFEPLFVSDPAHSDLVQIEDVPKRRKGITKLKDLPRGCEPCPLNKVKGINKVLGKITGKDILVFAQCPGPEENEREKELIGPSGKLIWKELRLVGIERDDCDVQNVVRCYTADRKKGDYGAYLKMRSPTKQEIFCCSLHTDAAMGQSKAKQILVLGQVAAKALLGVRSLPKAKVFWSDKYKAKIYLVDHPSFFLRGYGQGARFDNFRRILEQLAADRKQSGEQLADRFAYVRKQDYRLVLNRAQALTAEKEIRAVGRRVTFDLEYYKNAKDEWELSCIGFSPKIGQSHVFVVNHRDVPKADGQAVLEVAKSILEDSDVHKGAHYGCSDVTKCKELANIDVKTFDHDTLFSEYLRFSDKRKYGLDELMETRFPEFSGYSMVIVEEMLAGVDVPAPVKTPEARYKYLNDNNLFDIAKLSLDTLRLYNGADCDLCKRLESQNKKHVPQALMQLYIDLSFVLMLMEPNGPVFDFQQNEALLAIYPGKVDKSLADMRKMLNWEDYNPRSTPDVKEALYDRLALEFPFEGKPDTTKMTLLMLSREHEFPKKQIEYRAASRVVGTLEGYKFCAEANNGHLITNWRGTGTRTGRLSSGGDKGKAKKRTKVNLQNIKKDDQVRNVCVADKEWRKAYRAVGRIIKKYPDEAKAAAEIEAWITKHMPDLKTYLAYDYGQVEVRVAAQMAGDENLIKDCAESDIHTRVGVTMTGWDAEKIKADKVTRTLTKNCHFGVLFGLSKQGLFKFVQAMSPIEMRDRVTQEQVEDAYDRYFARYPQIREFQLAQIEFGREHHYVETLFGMKQVLNVTDDGDAGDDEAEIVDDSLDGVGGAYWGNQSINGPVQGTAHQLMICALVNLIRRILRYKILGIPVLEVHDALAFAVRVLDLPKAYKKGKYLLERESLATVVLDFPDINWRVPIAVDANAGLRLGCMVDIDENTTVGVFMIEWFKKCRKQVIELNKQLKEAAVGA